MTVLRKLCHIVVEHIVWTLSSKTGKNIVKVEADESSVRRRQIPFLIFLFSEKAYIAHRNRTAAHRSSLKCTRRFCEIDAKGKDKCIHKSIHPKVRDSVNQEVHYGDSIKMSCYLFNFSISIYLGKIIACDKQSLQKVGSMGETQLLAWDMYFQP